MLSFNLLKWMFTFVLTVYTVDKLFDIENILLLFK